MFCCWWGLADIWVFGWGVTFECCLLVWLLFLTTDLFDGAGRNWFVVAYCDFYFGIWWVWWLLGWFL